MENSLPIRVRYNECDPMGVVHHAAYPVWFEMGRTELLRAQGMQYKKLEEENVFFVVSSLAVKYLAPARYDDALTLVTTCTQQKKVTLTHFYELRRDDVVLTRGETVIACVDQNGNVQPIPDELQSISE